MSRYIIEGDVSDLDIAVIGMSCRFPGAQDIDAFWRNLVDGVESIKALDDEQLLEAQVDPALLKDPRYVKAAAWVDQIEQFDAQFFGYSPKEAELLDPQGRLLLECAWEALEQAGHCPRTTPQEIGVFVSASLNTYLLQHLHRTIDFKRFILSGGNIQTVLGNLNDFLSSRLSYKLNLTGPSIDIQTACSSALVAVHQACQSLIAGECRMALAGGASIYLPQKTGYLYEEGLILSPDGHCRVFDAEANGTVFGRGGGVVLLRLLSEALAEGDIVHAVIKGSAVNNDGSAKAGFTAPSVDGQARVIAEAIANANISPETIGYVEAHGTGTRTGDPIEISGLTIAFRAHTARKQFCAIGSVKSNIGHLDAASGIASLIKTVLVLKNGVIPPSLHFRKSNPEIDFNDSPFYVNTALRPWADDGALRRAGVSSFGMGGTNAHMILESAPALEVACVAEERSRHILALSAKSGQALQELVLRCERHLKEHADLLPEDICFTANTGRGHYLQRLAVVGESTAQLGERLGALHAAAVPQGVQNGSGVDGENVMVAFLFTGQGAQYAGMGRTLFMTHPGFRREMERCDRLLRPYLEVPLLEVLYGSGCDTLLSQTAYTQPAMFALEYSLAQLWISWGVRPAAVLGHSGGEYAAACVAGVFSLEDGITLIAERGRLMQSLPAGGAMAAVFGTAAQVRSALKAHSGEISIAAVNGLNHTVLSGDGGALATVIEALGAEGIEHRYLSVSHAFHSPLMEPMLEAFGKIAERVRYAVPQVGLVSNVTGELIRDGSVSHSGYWCRHVREPVQFARSMTTLSRQAPAFYVEIGPQPVLLNMGRRCIDDKRAQWLPSLCRDSHDWDQLLDSLGRLYMGGVSVDWDGFDREYPRRRVALPTYPFQRKRYWIENDATTVPPLLADERKRQHVGHLLLGRRLYSPLFSDTVYAAVLSVARIPWLADHSVRGMAVLPATAYLEMLAVAAERHFDGDPWKVNELVISDPMIFQDDSECSMQMILQPHGGSTSAFRLMSMGRETLNDASDWKLHASGVIERDDGVGWQDFDDFFDRGRWMAGDLEEVSPETYYQSLAAMELTYGPTFRGIRQLRRAPNESMALVQAPPELSIDRPTYGLHPALLDACLQVVLAALPDTVVALGHTRLFLPMVMRQARLRPTASDQLWCRVVLQPCQELQNETLHARVAICDATGLPVVSIDDLQLKRAGAHFDRNMRGTHENWLYEIQWLNRSRREPAHGLLSAGFLPSPRKIEAQLKIMVPPLRRRFGMDAYERLQPELDTLCAAYISECLQILGLRFEAGKRFSLDELALQLGVLDQHRNMLRRMLQILQEDGDVKENAGIWTIVRQPIHGDTERDCSQLLEVFASCRIELLLAKRCGESLAGVLSGKTNPMDLLFPGGSLNDLENLYQRASFASVYNILVQNAVDAALKRLPAGRTLRVLEVGAGTGGTASGILPRLDPAATEYYFTDVSPHFMNKARDKFKEYDFVTYRLLDIEHDPQDQGFTPGYFDLVLATNVLHATRHLDCTLMHVRRMLKPGGLLIMVEGIDRQRWVDLIFGMTEGWWLFEDKKLREDYPLVNLAKWQAVLKRAGFAEIATLPEDDCQCRMLFNQGILIARAALTASLSADLPEAASVVISRRWLVWAEDSRVGGRLQQLLQEQGDTCDLLLPDDRSEHGDPARLDQLTQILNAAAGPYHGAAYICHMGKATEIRTPLDELKADIDLCGSGLLHFIQALTAGNGGAPSRLWVVTAGSQPVIGEGSFSLAQAPLWGMCKVAALEHPELRCTCVDLDPLVSDAAINGLFEEMVINDEERQIGLRGRSRFVPRLVRSSGGHASGAIFKPFRLDCSGRGRLDSLCFIPARRKRPGRGEIEIRINASGLNLKDVLNVLGTYPGDAGPLGLECAGEVIRVGEDVTLFQFGDEVLALASGSFGSHVTVAEQMAARKPCHLSFEEAAAMPVSFATAYYALCHLARMTRNDGVLIHAAAGGVGMAALQLAKRCGATVFATAGSPEKRKLVKSLGADYVMDSRTLQFADEISAITSGKGVDIVLNSLAGDFVAAGLSVLKQNGRFCELGKKDILEPEVFYASRPDAAYFVIDVGDSLSADPELARQILTAIIEGVTDGSLVPPPVQRFPLAKVEEAFRYMAQARHVGKIVFNDHAQLDNALIKPALKTTLSNPLKPYGLDPSASYLVTGGRGGLGLLMARWMVERGARHLILAGRSEPTPTALNVIDELQNAGATVHAPQLDVASPGALSALFQEFGVSRPPLKGIVHGAGDLDDGVLMQLTWPRFTRLFQSKIYGAWLLHHLSQGMNIDFFILFSSIASVLGSPGQANHAAANAFMDTLSHFRRSFDLPALTVNWGAWSRIGAAARKEVLQHLAIQGIGAITPEQGLALFEKLLMESCWPSVKGICQVGVLNIDWTRYLRQFPANRLPRFLDLVAGGLQGGKDSAVRTEEQGPTFVDRLADVGPARQSELLQGYIAELIGQGLGLEPDQSIDSRRSFNDYGLDSLMAVDLRSRISSALKLKEPLPVTMFFDYPNLEALSAFIAREVFYLSGDPRPVGTGVDSARARQVAEIESLSEDEAEALLLKELSAGSDGAL